MDPIRAVCHTNSGWYCMRVAHPLSESLCEEKDYCMGSDRNWLSRDYTTQDVCFRKPVESRQ